MVTASPFPWRDQVQDFIYRVVEVRGVFDHHREMLVGPRPGTDDAGETRPGYNVVTPLRLEDSSTLLVNRGHLRADLVDPAARREVPTYARLKNRPDKNQFVYLLADDLAENAGARNHQECSQALLTAFDVLCEDDFQAGVHREVPFIMRHKEDYLLFWAD